MISKILIG